MLMLLACFLTGAMMLGMDLLTESRCYRAKQNPRVTIGGESQ